MQRLLFEGSDIDELLARVRAEHGPDAEIVDAQERLVGGVGGFSARRRFEVAVQLPDGPTSRDAAADEPAASAGSAAPADLPGADEPRPAPRGRHRGQEQTVTASGRYDSPIASTLYDALGESLGATGSGSFEDLLSVADRQDGVVPAEPSRPRGRHAAPVAPDAPSAAGSASAAEEPVFRPAPYVPASALAPPPRAAGQARQQAGSTPASTPTAAAPGS